MHTSVYNFVGQPAGLDCNILWKVVSMGELYEILYLSTLSPHCNASVVGPILATARRENARAGITGVLAFDGLHFVQYIEGSRSACEDLLSRLQADTRHAEMKILHQGPSAQRRYEDFRMGYVQMEELDMLNKLEPMQGAAAVDFFVHLVPDLDMG